MSISENINDYLKDSMIAGRVCRFNIYYINIYISRISSKFISEAQKNEYYYLAEKAINIWNQLNCFKFVICDTPQNANIVINWVKTGRIYEGMCKFRSIIASEIRSVTIDIGLPNEHSPKTVNNNSILHSILHELGHAAGLGHGIDENDLMYVPHKKSLNTPSNNDIYIVQKIYSVPPGTTYTELTNKKSGF
ncbi:MAG: matrixin family metalloprotease [Candidatus Gastranaerophilaceae bacterium]